MSYDLYFWAYADEAAYSPGKSDAFQATCTALAEGKLPSNLRPIDKAALEKGVVDAMKKAQGWEEEGWPFWVKRPSASLEANFGTHHVSFGLRGRWTDDDANRLIDLMHLFGCPLYDPQTGERFRL